MVFTKFLERVNAKLELSIVGIKFACKVSKTFRFLIP
uniref:Uncharacterized protein n=1 Tax=Tetranychus urticae TaxID=32264 RepID=T1K2B3_TETUR